ncbi:hypothetical protein M422DRAFT_60570 [Sphaerobolus stellatus SS14]|uniref:Nucleoporin Nup54 alpha-helical domain-containing protein n=1 Tax=Sphaerobolus stellatus (strain SS14) TaxID=990650 RepID=A0A0C9VG89_SPHS4|nr:hypothetical protein M422DRAFT_60570 [Sphaerobolus stellatus SS14]
MSIFGAPNAFGSAPAGTSAFSSTGTVPSNTFGNTGTAATSAFGNTGAGQNAFGTGQSAFGNPGSGQSAFGNLGINTSGLGNTAPNTNPFGGAGGATNTFGGSLFGTNQNTSTGTSAFGNPTGGPAPGTTSHPFNNPYMMSNPLLGLNNTTTTNPLFGGNQPQQGANTGTGPIFGNPAGNTTTGPSLFGQSQQSQQPQQNSLFGSTPSLFGTSTAGPSLFSSTNMGFPSMNQNPLSTSALGGGNPLFGSKPSGSTLPTAGSNNTASSTAVQQGHDLQQRIEGIIAAWNPASPQCRFQHYFYNVVDPKQVHLYGRPANATNDALWQQAVRENPEPSCMVPVLAVGFDDLQKRVDAQSKSANEQHEKLKELQSRLHTLSQTHVLQTTLRTARALQAHTVIIHRLLRLIEHLHLLIPSLRSSSISPEEEALRARLERLKDELIAGGGRGRLNELWAVVGAVKAARESAGQGEGIEWKVVDQEGFERLGQVLNEQQQGLAHLTSVINNGLKDLQILEGTEPRPARDHLGASGLFGSTFGR